MNDEERPQDQSKDIKEMLRDFLQHELGFVDAQSIEIYHVHHRAKSKDGKNLLRFLHLS